MTLRPPKQDRSRRTLDRLTRAAMDLMAVHGVEGTSVAQIVRAARSSVGSFYARFSGKDDFVAYLEGRVWEDARERWDLALHHLHGRDLTTPELVAGLVRLLVETSEADLDRRRVLGTASGSAARATAFHGHVLGSVTRTLLTREEEFAHPDPAQAISLGYWVIAGALQELQALHAAVNGGGPESLVSELTRLYLAYLGSDAEPPLPRFGVAAVPSPEVVAAQLEVTTVTPLPAQAHTEPPLVPAPDASEAAQASDTPVGPQAPVVPESDEAAESEPERVDFFDVWG